MGKRTAFLVIGMLTHQEKKRGTIHLICKFMCLLMLLLCNISSICPSPRPRRGCATSWKPGTHLTTPRIDPIWGSRAPWVGSIRGGGAVVVAPGSLEAFSSSSAWAFRFLSHRTCASLSACTCQMHYILPCIAAMEMLPTFMLVGLPRARLRSCNAASPPPYCSTSNSPC